MSVSGCFISISSTLNGIVATTAPALAESRACGAEKQSVWLTRMPSPVRYFTALSPSLVSGHLTTTFGATCASSLPSFTMPSKSVATTSRLTSPGTTRQISSTSGRKGRFSLAISEGLVVQPSTRPIATPSRSSLTFALSRKIFIQPSLSGALDPDLRPGAHRLEHSGITQHATEDVDRARGPDLVAPTRGRLPEEDAERGAGGPVGKIAQLHHLAGVLRLGLHRDAEVDLVPPGLAGDVERERVPDRRGRLRGVQHRVGRDTARGDPDLPLRHVDSSARSECSPGPRERQGAAGLRARAGAGRRRAAPRGRRGPGCPRPRRPPRTRPHSRRPPPPRPTHWPPGC